MNNRPLLSPGSIQKEHHQRRIRNAFEGLLHAIDLAGTPKECTRLENALLDLVKTDPFAAELHRQYCAMNLQVALLMQSDFFTLRKQGECPPPVRPSRQIARKRCA